MSILVLVGVCWLLTAYVGLVAARVLEIGFFAPIFVFEGDAATSGDDDE